MRYDYQNSVNNIFNVKNAQGVEINALEAKRKDSNYTNKDQNWQTESVQGDIYLSVPNDTHNYIVNHHNDPANKKYNLPENGYPGVSGFFTNEETVSKHFTEGGRFDSVGLGHDLQQAPYFDKNKADIAETLGQKYTPEYNSHLDCFRVNKEKMLAEFGTADFHAAMSKCTENTAWGDGGGTQGYNSYINEMINKGCLEYVPEKSRTCSNNECLDYTDRKEQASKEAEAVDDYIKNNNIKGNLGERLGYNELPKQEEISDQSDNNPSNKVSSQNIACMGGGGANAPNNSEFNPQDYIPAHKNNSVGTGMGTSIQ